MSSSSTTTDTLTEPCPGVHRCSAKKCDCCDHMLTNISEFRATRTSKSYSINQDLSCTTSKVIYIIQCKVCSMQYVGKTVSALKTRFSSHKSSISKEQHRPLANHFNSNGHRLEDLLIFPIEQVCDRDSLKEREAYWVEELQTLDYGINLVPNESGAPKRRNEEECGPRPPKKARKKNRVPVFSSETEGLLTVCEDATEEARKIISQVHQKLKKTSCSRAESSEFLQDLKKKISDLKEQKLNEKIYIGLLGRTGAGKSSLINAIVDESQILPSGRLHACTSVLVYVQANAELDKDYRADIEFISKEDWEAELRFLVEILSNEQGERPNADSEGDKEMQKMAEEKIRAIYGEEGLRKSYDELVGNRQFPQIPENCRRTFTFHTAAELSQNIGCYIRSDKKMNQQYWPLVKCVTISLPRSPALLDRIVLVDLPGAGDANKQRDEMWKECLSRCASIWIVNDINRALSDKEAHKIFQESLRSIAGGGECHNITFICTKTDLVNVEEIRSEVSNQDLDLTEPEDSPDYERKEKQACILYQNAEAKCEIEKSHKAKVQKLLSGEGDEEISDSFFHVFTVSSSEYKKIKQGKSSVLDCNETELPLLIEHIKKLYVSHSEKEVKDYVSDISGLVSYLHLAKNPCNDKIKSFNDSEFDRLKKDLFKTCQTLEKFLSEVHSDLKENLESGAKAAEKESWDNAKAKVIDPTKRDFRGYHKTLKALCKNNGFFRSRNGDIIDLNYTLSESMYRQMNKTNLFLKTFSSRGRKSINGNFESFQVNFISSDQLKKYRMEQEKYLRLVYIKIKQRKLLRHLEKETLHRKKCIYNSLSDSVRETMQPTYSKCAGTMRYTVTQIQNELNDKISSSKNTMFQEAMNEMLRQFDDLKNWILRELEADMLTAMKLALTQIPDDFVDLPDVDEELEILKTHCESLDLKLFV